MTLSADLKAIHEAGAKDLPRIATEYENMAAKAAGLADLHATQTRPTAADFWPDALGALGALFRRSAENTGQAGDVLRMIAYAYAATDEEAAGNLQKAAELDHLPSYVYGEWR